MQITILGSGTSHGVPMIGCDCSVCRSSNPKDRRFRPSILVQKGAYSILVDTTPELRMQALAFDVRRVDAVLVTHTHADHIMGLDDIRRFNDLADAEIPVYGAREHLDDIRRIFPYIFMNTQAGGGKPRVSLNEMVSTVDLFGIDVEPITVLHGRIPVTAYRFTTESATGSSRTVSAAYVTDVSTIPDAAMERLVGLDLLILDAVRIEPHPTHFGLYQALDVIEKLDPARALLTHLSHHMDHDGINALLPPHIKLAFDGQCIDISNVFGVV